MSEYITMDDVRLYGYQFDEDAQGPVYQKIIPRASAIFEDLCRVNAGYFNKAGDIATERTIYGSGTSYLTLPPHVGEIAITVPENYTMPTYAEVDNTLWLTDSTGVRYPAGSTPTWWRGVAITVVGRWGFPEIPDDVKEAVVELAVSMFRSKDTSFMKSIDLENQTALTMEIPLRTKLIASKYRGGRVSAAFV